MKLVLLKDDKRFGKKGDIVNVADGYANNYVIPNKIAIPLTNASLNEAKQLKESEQHKQNTMLLQAKEMAKKLENVDVVLAVKVGEGGKIFGSVNNKEIAEKLKEKGLEIDRKKIELAEPIKAVGRYFVKVKLHPQVNCKLAITVVAQ